MSERSAVLVDPNPLRVREQRGVALVFAIGMFMSILDTQIVNVALAEIGRDFGAGTSQTQWIVTGYLVSLAVFVPAAGWLGDRFGTRRVYLIAVVLFTAASVACAFAPSLAVLIAARAIQGVGGGMLLPIGQTVLYRAYEPAERVRVARSISRITVIAPATAPIIGGVLVTNLSWHWIFLINVPFGVLLFCLALALRPYRAGETERFDALGAVLGGGGLAATLYAISQGPRLGWGSAQVIGVGLAGLALLVLFVRRETRIVHPVLKLHLLRDRMLRRGSGVIVLMTMAFFGCILFTPLYLQQGLGVSAMESGLTTFPCAVGIGISAQIVGRLYPHVGPKRLMIGGFIGMAAMAVVLSTNGEADNLWIIRAEMLLFGLCVPFVMLSTQASVFARVSHADTSHAASIFTSVQRTGSAVGAALLATVLGVAAGGDIEPDARDFRVVYFAIAAVALVGVVAAARVHDSDAAETMVPVVRSKRAFGLRARRKGPGPTEVAANDATVL